MTAFVKNLPFPSHPPTYSPPTSPIGDNDLYYSDSIGLRNSPLLEPKRVNLQPSPSPPLDISLYSDSRDWTGLGDKVLLRLMGNSRQPEIACSEDSIALNKDNTDKHYRATSAIDDDYLPISNNKNTSQRLPLPKKPRKHRNKNLQVGTFQCEFPGCTIQPFQTKAEKDSHGLVHSSNRPYYCPVKNCLRSEGGKGFKRNNEMIRHRLVHDSPGYVCPFCLGKEYKYLRPDSLLRHVRFHHVDKDKDDPKLRDVLDKRLERPN